LAKINRFINSGRLKNPISDGLMLFKKLAKILYLIPYKFCKIKAAQK
jgi:hypothetical protein